MGEVHYLRVRNPCSGRCPSVEFDSLSPTRRNVRSALELARMPLVFWPKKPGLAWPIHEIRRLRRRTFAWSLVLHSQARDGLLLFPCKTPALSGAPPRVLDRTTLSSSLVRVRTTRDLSPRRRGKWSRSPRDHGPDQDQRPLSPGRSSLPTCLQFLQGQAYGCDVQNASTRGRHDFPLQWHQCTRTPRLPR